MPSKRTRYDRIAVVERPADEEDESSEEEEDADEEDSDCGQDDDDTSSVPVKQPASQQPAKQGKLSVAFNRTSELVCHVCGAKGHKAGFVGATYFDCPNRPCYLCKGVGHTTATCPHRAAPGISTAVAAAVEKDGSTSHLLMQREQVGRQRRGPLAPPRSHPWQVEAAILKLHNRRVCCLEFPVSSSSSSGDSSGSSSSHVISGDKKGNIAVWNFTQVHDRTIYKDIHWALVNTICWCPWMTGGFNCSSSSSDGTAKIFDIETGTSQTLLNLNPDGWHQGCKWNMFYGSGANQELKVVLAGDNDGKVHMLDPRVGSGSSSSSSASVSCLQLHKAGSKVNSVSVNPVGGAHVVLTAGSDHNVKLFDVRKLTSIRSTTAAGSSSSSPPAPRTPATAAAGGSSPRNESTATAAAAPVDVAAAGSSRGRGRGSRGRGRAAGRGRGRNAAAAGAADGDVDSDDDNDNDLQPAAAAAASGRGRGRGRGRGSSSAAAAAAAAAAGGSSNGSTTPSKASRAAKAAAVAAAAAAELAVMRHSRVVNHAVFSPSGQKILTTCQDNRLRIWDNLLACQGPATVEIVHSHDFNRYLTPFKAEWFPNDPSDSRIICGRYISENFGGVALHPVDIYDATNGRLLQQLIDLNLNTITPVNKPHPRLDVIISGSSRSLYKWVPQYDEDDDDSLRAASPADLVRQVTGAAAAMAAARSSSTFMGVDADADGSGSGKRKKAGAGSSSGAGTKSVTKSKVAGGTKNVSQDPAETGAGRRGRGRGTGSTAMAGMRGRKRGRQSAAAAETDDDNNEAADDNVDSDCE